MSDEQSCTALAGSPILRTAPNKGGGALGRRLMLALKIVATVLALALVGRLVDPAVLVARVRAADPKVFATAVLLMALQIPLVALRWRCIVAAMNREGGVLPGPAKFLQVTYVAQVFGQILPSVAGDGLRVLMLREAGPSLRIAFKSTLLDRATAALVLLALALPTALLSPILITVRAFLWPAITIIACGLSASLALIAGAEVLHRVGRRWRIVGAVTETLMDLRAILASQAYGPAVVLLCFAVHGLSISVFWLLAHGQGLPFGAVDAVAVVPLVLLVSMMPIAIGGWGVREGFVVVLLGASGVGREDALLLSLSFGTAVLLATLPGLALLAASAWSPRPRTGPLPGKALC